MLLGVGHFNAAGTHVAPRYLTDSAAVAVAGEEVSAAGPLYGL